MAVLSGFFMQIHGIEFEDSIVDMATDWNALKESLTTTGRNPCGTLPVVTDGAHDMSQHVAIARHLARVHDVASGDPWDDYVQDLLADEYQGWRAKWVNTAWTVPQEIKDTYIADEVPKMLKVFEALYAKYKADPSAPYISTSPSGKALWGDVAVFGLLFDHMARNLLTRKQVAKYRNLDAVYDGISGEPKVAAWIKEKGYF